MFDGDYLREIAEGDANTWSCGEVRKMAAELLSFRALMDESRYIYARSGAPDILNIPKRFWEKLNRESSDLRAENDKLRKAIQLHCRDDCHRDACDGNEDVGIPNCRLATICPPRPESEDGNG